jgi:hypothetical protein
MIERACSKHEIGVKREGRHPVRVVLEGMYRSALYKRTSSISFQLKNNNTETRTFSASHILTVRSLLAVYNTPLGPPAPPHLTTLTLAECPPSVYSVLRVRVDHTRTVPSFEDDAIRGADGFLFFGWF